MIKTGVLIPTRGDRPKMLNFCLDRLDKQTYKPTEVEVVDDTPLSKDKDITWRYRIGCERLMSKGVDVIFLMEDDDYYHTYYLEYMLDAWNKVGCPDIFGIGETTYYHLGIKSYYNVRHPLRASAFSTMMTTRGLQNMKWPNDNYPFTDIELWKNLKGHTFMPLYKKMAIGIKGYDMGELFGGIGHDKNWSGYNNPDPGLLWLKDNIDKEAFDFYKKIMNLLTKH